VIRRGRITRDKALELVAEANDAATSGALSGRTDLPPFERIAESFRERVRELGSQPISEPPPDEEPLDYVRLVDEEHEHRHRRRRQGMG
jgi:hypothetical protein